MSRRITGFMVLLLTLALMGTLSAQVNRGSISGTITDPQGAVITGATVKATNVDNASLTYTTTSDSSGLFRFNLIPAGTYKVEISHGKDYRPAVRDNVLVSAGADAGLGQIKMVLGTAETTVEVKAEAAPLVTNEAQVTNTFTGNTLTSVPVVQGNNGLDNLALFIPGVTDVRDNGFSNTNGGNGFSVNGLRGRSNDQQIDGQNNNDNSVGGPQLFLSNPEFVSQYVVTTDNFGPEYGRNAGSVVNILTKSGTNAWHGAIYGSENNSILNALDNENKNQRICGTGCLTKPDRLNDEFGGFTIGGPWIKNKLFFFGGFDQEIVSRQGTFTSSHPTPTPAGLATLAACFPGSAGLAALQSFGAYGITAGNPQPIASSITSNTIAGPISGTSCPNVEEALVTRTIPRPIHIFDFFLKNDLQFTNDTISGRYIFQRNNFFASNDLGGAGYFINVPDINSSALISWTHNLSSRMVNEARISFGRTNVEFGGGISGAVEPTAANLNQALTNVSFNSTGDEEGFGPATNLPQARIVNTWQAQDNWNWVKGKHSIKAGINWTYQRSPNIFLPLINGSYRFSTLGALMDDAPNLVRVGNGPSSLDFREYDTFLYVGDDWKVRSNLTVQAGLTWSYYGQPMNLLHDITTKRESNPATAFWSATEPTTGGFLNPGAPIPLADRTVPELNAPKTSFGPSLGFAYTPGWGGFLTGHGQTVVRGGYRLAYDPPYYNIYLNVSTSAPEVFLATVCGSTSACNTDGVHMPAVPFGPNVRASLSPFLTLGKLDPRTGAETSVSPNFGPDMVHSWSFGVERQIGSRMAFEARYVGNAGRKLFQTLNGNPRIDALATDFPALVPAGETPCPSTSAFAPAAIGRIDCNHGIERIRSNSAFSNYNGLQTEFRVNNLFNQLTLKSAYTWSKTLDNVSEIFDTFGGGNTAFYAQNPANQINFPGEYSISGLHIPHQWSMLFNEDLPFFRNQKGATGHIFGGWSVSGTYVLASGQRYSPVQFFEATFSQAGNYNDTSFIQTFAGVFDSEHPFLGNLNAPATAVGIYAGDACGLETLTAAQAAVSPLCLGDPNALVSLNAIGASGCESDASIACPYVPTTSNDVRFIMNTGQAQTVFGTPFGNSPRNPVTDAISNVGSVSISKKIKFTERSSFTFTTTLFNAFNHAAFSSVDPFLSDAGLQGDFNGFGDPTLTATTPRRIVFSGKLTF